ncbi:MAG: hypothetical protein ABIJ86_13820 [Spirochaetota bacterium]
MRFTKIWCMATAALLILPFSVVHAQRRDASFETQGLDYVAETSGYGSTEVEAINDARLAAILQTMESLGRDRLFTELFLKNPPVTMNFTTLSSEKSLTGWTVRIKLVIDDESIRLLYNSLYISTVTTILDSVEANLLEAERLGAEARSAETDGQIGRAMSLYWQARDASEVGLGLLEPVGDAAVVSTSGRKKAPELREVLTAVRTTMSNGYDRIKSAERSLADDKELASVMDALTGIEEMLFEVDERMDSISPVVSQVEQQARESLIALRDQLDIRYKTLADARLELSRLEKLVPRSNELMGNRVDIARRKIDRNASYIASSRKTVDKEIRNPAIVRAKRAQTVRWIFLHEPTRSLSLRLYSPFGLDPESNDFTFIETDRVEFGLAAENSFGDSSGLWMRTMMRKDDAVLAFPEETKNTGDSQAIDLGFYRNWLCGIGFGWDWLRRSDGESLERKSVLRAFTGGMTGQPRSPLWLAVLSWELPYDTADFAGADGLLWYNALNFGLDGTLRLGTFAELDAGLSWRARETVEDSLDEVFRYSIGAGFRLPKPLLWGIEYAGHTAAITGEDPSESAAYVRLYLEYTF